MSVGMEIENETILHQRHLVIMTQCQEKEQIQGTASKTLPQRQD